MKLTDANWFNEIPSNWKSWVIENLQRGCDPHEMSKIIDEHGFRLLSGQSFEEKLRHLNPDENAPAPEPTIERKKAKFSLTHLAELNDNVINLNGHDIRLIAHFANPSVFYFDQVLTAAECDQMIELSEHQGRLKRSTVVDINNGSDQIDQRRSSESTWFPRGANELVGRIEQRIADLIRWPATHGEGLQVLRYQAGGEYRPHVDYFDPKLAGSQKHLAIGGQRVATLIMYLSDVEAGGGTSLPNLGLEFKPKKGAGLLFANVDAYGEPHVDTLHAGLPVVSGVKYIATKWLRESVYG